MKPKLRLTTLDQLRAFADPLRVRLVEELVAGELPVTGLAKALGVPVTRLYHHVDLLLETGLIEVARQVRRRGVEERVFRAAARRYQLDRNLLALSPGRTREREDLVPLARAALGGALDDLIDGLNSRRVQPSKPGHGLVLQGRRVKLSAHGFVELAKALPEWLDRFLQRHRATRGRDYRITIAAFPAGRKVKRS